MKYKRRRVLEVPQKVRSTISSITNVALENIQEPLKGFVWEFDKGDFHHWVDLFNHFDSFFEKFIKPRKDLQVEDNFLEADPPFPRDAVLQILRVTRIILENCTNKHFYSSYEHHLSSLLASIDADVFEASLQTLAASLKKPVGKCSIRDASLTTKLFAISQGWGSKEEGLGLIACSLNDGCDLVASEIGSALHFEFYATGDSSKESNDIKHAQGLQVIHLPNVSLSNEDDFVVLHQLVQEYNVPPKLRFSLLTRLRFARAFGSLTSRHQYICIRLYAFIALVQASIDANDLTTFFNNEPEFINELVSLLNYEDEVPEKIRILGIQSLVALCQDRTRQTTVLSSVTSGGYRGILPSLMQKAVETITSGSTNLSVVFVEGILSLVSVLVSSTPGSLALQEAGYIPTILPLLKDTNPEHLQLVSTAVHVIEGFLDFNNPTAALFRDLGGLDDAIARLRVEVSYIEKGSKKNEEVSLGNSKGKQVICGSSELDLQPFNFETLVAYHRKILMKALLRAISLATYVPGSSGRIDGSEESILPICLCSIFKRPKDFGGGVFSLAAIVMSDLLHKDPTCFPVLDAAGLPQAFLDAIGSGVLCSAEAVTCIPQCLDALCLNNTGLQMVRERNALRCFVKIFTSQSYLRALSGDTPGTLSSALDELLRHASSLRAPGVDMLIEILNLVANIGAGTESNDFSTSQSSTHVPMETDSEGGKPVSSGEGGQPKTGNSERKTESSDATSGISESFLPECVNNVARLLETILQNADTCRLFIEKKGLEAVLRLFTLELMPISVPIGQNLSVAFKSFSPQQSSALCRAVCSFTREHLKMTNELWENVGGAKLAQIESAKQLDILRSLSSLEALLSLSNSLLKGTTMMASELGSSDADILTELGKTYKEVLWQLSLSSDSKVEEKQETDQEAGSTETSVSNVAGRESDDDGNAIPLVRYMNPVSVRSSSASHWNGEHDFVSVVRSAGSMHRHGRHGLSRIRGSRLSRQLDASLAESEVSINTMENSVMLDIKKKNPSTLVPELLLKLGFTIRSFFASLVKGLSARRRVDSNTSLSPASKSLVTAVAKLFHDALNYAGHPTAGLETWSLKCQYLGKVVDDMAALIFDSRRRSCNTALVNSFYANGTFKEILTTFVATSQLLWTPPFSVPTPGHDQDISVQGSKVSHNSWLLDTLQSYCRLLECHVNGSLLLSPSPPSQVQLLVQPIASGLSIGLFPIPREPEMFVRLLQSQVLDVILPVWIHPMFPNCSPTLITSVVSIVTHIISGVGDLKRGHSGASGITGQRITAPALDESTIATILEMGFTRARAEEAVRSVGTNSVEMATDWLFSHPEEFVQEDVQLAQALALSLGNSSEAIKDDSVDDAKNVFTEDKGAEAPPVDDILAASMKLLQCSDSMAFHLTDLLVTLCNRNKGEDRPRVVVYLIQQLKQCPADFAKETGALCPISHLLALTLSEDSGSRELAAENGVISAVLDVLSNFRWGNESRIESSVTKSLSALFLILNYMLQSRPKVPTELPEGSSKSLSDSSGVGMPLVIPTPNPEVKSENNEEKDTCSVFEKILGKSTGYMTLGESQKAMTIACEFVKQQVPAIVMQAVLQLCARLTKTHAIATQFLESGGLAALFSLPRICMFPGFDSFASVIIRHLLEDPQTLQTAMELEIRQTLTGSHSRHAGRLVPRLFLTSMAPVISRNPEIFMKAAAAVCQLEPSGGRMNIVLSKEKEKDKEREKDKDKLRTAANEGLDPSSDPVRLSENKPTNDTPAKCPRSHKRVPASLYQVIDQLLEIIMSYPSAKKLDECNSSLAPMEVDEPIMKEKGKSKVDETGETFDNLSERAALLAKITFVLKLMSDILLMYVHAVGVVLRRDSETYQQRGSGQAGGPAHGGIVHHVLHELLPLASEKTSETSDEWKDKLSEKASWFLVVLCGRSTEGRKRVISEVVKAFSSFSYVESNCSKRILLPDKKVLAFVDLVHSILSKNASSTVPGPGCSPDIAKTMIDGGIVQSLSNILRVIDLDHPDAPKIVNLILKALENLTRAANARDHVLKLDEINKKTSSGVHESIEEPNTAGPDIAHQDHNANHQQDITDAAQTEIPEGHESSRAVMDPDSNPNPPMGDDMRVDREENANNPHTEDDVHFMRQVDGDALPGTNEVGLAFQVEHRTDDEMGDDDEDMGDDGEDEEEEEEEDEEDEDMAEEGGAVISLADTDVEDHDDIGMDDEYNDDMIEEEEDDFPENRVIEVRWRDGLGGLDQLRVLSRRGDANGFIDIASEPFEGVNADDIFHLHRPLGAERRRQTARTDRSGLDGSAFLHPLLSRPSQSGESISSVWSAVGSSSRDLEALSFGGFDVAHYYMFDSGHPSDHGAATVHGDRFVGAAPPALIDFSLGIDSQYIGGRRGQGDNRWTDDGQPQAGGHAATIAQAVEEQFVSQLRGAMSVDNPVAQRQNEHSEGHGNQQAPVLNASPARLNNLAAEPDEGQQQIGAVPFNHIQNVAVEGGQCLPDFSHGTVDAQSVVGAEENQGAPEVRQMFSGDLDAGDNDSEYLNTGEGVGPNITLVDPLSEAYLQSAHLLTVDHHMQDRSEASGGSQSAHPFSEHVAVESHSSSHALIDSGSAMPDSSDGRAGSTQTRVDFDMNGACAVGNQAEISVPASVTGEELSSAQNTSVPPENGQAEQVNNNEASSTNAIDPTFLEALPEDLRAEVLASQQAQPAQASTYAPPPAEEIDPEFLAALPPDIQAEVLAQQRAQRIIHQTEGQPVDMDNASIIATFPPDLREEVLLTSSEAVLSALPSSLLAEAQILRDRAVSHYHARSSLFGGSHRLVSRRLAADRQAVMDRGVGVGQRAGSAVTNSPNVKELEGPPLLDAIGLQAVIRPVRLAQPLGKGLLQRLLLNLCAHSVQRANLVGHLVDMLRPEADRSSGAVATTSQRLYGCQWNVVYSRPQPSDGLPPLVSRRILEILTYLATNHSSVANILFYLDPSSSFETSTNAHLDFQKKKGKEKICDAKDSLVTESSLNFNVPLILFLKLLNRPLFLRSSAHLEQVMGLLQVVVNHAVAKVDSLPRCEQAKVNSEVHAANGAPPDGQKDSSNLKHEPDQETNPSQSAEVLILGDNKSITTYDIFLLLPKPDLRNLCTILAHEGLSDKVYSIAADVMKKLAFVAVHHQKFFAFELAGLAHNLSVSAVGELVNLRNTHMLGPSSFSMAGAAILRVLQALSALTLVDGNKLEESVDEREEQSILLNLNVALEPLWQELSDCITSTEGKLGPTSSFSSSVSASDTGDLVSGGGSLSPPLPPGTHRLLPFVEAFFVLCEKLQMNQTIVPTDSYVTAREVKEFAGTSSSPSLRCGGTGCLTFAKLAEKHRRLLNVFIRQNPSLLEKSLSMMLKVPRLIDFDNKRSYFRARIRQQHDHHHSAPLRISVRRAYVLEDSYNQLRMRPTQDLKGRLTVQFQGEEGIDAGGLTREWYQLLSRVIFDKGALLFTNVGNAATFQPNPNSVYQTEHLSYFKFVGRVVAKALFDGQLLDVYFTRSFYKHILGVKVTYHDIEAVDPDYYKNLKWMLENDVSDIPDLTFSMDADEEKHILYEKTEVTDYELKAGGRNIRVTEETKHEYVDLVAEHILTTAIRPQINSFLEGFTELVPRDLISIFNDKELELLISGLPEIDFDDLTANTEYTGYTAASSVINWFWEVIKAFNKEDMARFLQFVTGTSKVPLEGFKALQGISGPQRFQIHKAYGAPERLPSAHTCFNQLDLPEYSSKEQLEERLLLAIHEASEGFGFG